MLKFNQDFEARWEKSKKVVSEILLIYDTQLTGVAPRTLKNNLSQNFLMYEILQNNLPRKK